MMMVCLLLLSRFSRAIEEEDDDEEEEDVARGIASGSESKVFEREIENECECERQGSRVSLV